MLTCGAASGLDKAGPKAIPAGIIAVSILDLRLQGQVKFFNVLNGPVSFCLGPKLTALELLLLLASSREPTIDGRPAPTNNLLSVNLTNK